MEIKIDVTDWNKQYQETEPNISSEEEIIKRAKDGTKPSEMGRYIIVAREKGDAPEDIIKPNKMILNTGAAVSVSRIIAKGMKKAELANGKTINVRSLTCPTDGVDFKVVVDSDSEAGHQNAINYLRNTIPGHIFSRLAIIAENGGDVEKHAQELIANIEEIVSQLT